MITQIQMRDFNRTGACSPQKLHHLKNQSNQRGERLNKKRSYKMSCMQLERILILKPGVKVMGVEEQTWIQ